jgi:hypothetical protein
MRGLEEFAGLREEPASDNAIRVEPMIAPTVTDVLGTR